MQCKSVKRSLHLSLANRTDIQCIFTLYVFCLRRRYGNFEDFLGRLEKVEGGVCKFSESYKNMGCRVGSDNTFICTQWIPGAQVKASRHVVANCIPTLHQNTLF